MWRQSKVEGKPTDKQCWYMHKEIFSGKDNVKPFKDAYVIKEDETCLIFKNVIDQKHANRTNTQFLCMMKTHQTCGGESPRRLLLKEDNFTTSVKPVVCDVDLLKDNEVVPVHCQKLIEEITNEKFHSLVEQQRIVLTQKVLYVLKADLNKEFWPFKMPDPINKSHFSVKPAQIMGKQDAQKQFDLKIMSYNVLADNYYYYFKNVKKNSVRSFEHMEFHYRAELIMKQIQASNSDIIGLQELDHYQIHYKQNMENLGYTTMVCEAREMIDYVTCLIGFKTDKFELLRFESVDARRLVDFYKENEIKFSVPGIVCVLKEKATQQVIIVANSHLFWDPRFDYVKMHQSLQLLQTIQDLCDEFQQTTDPLPIFCMGDYNSKSTSSVVHMMYGKAPEYDLSKELDVHLLDIMKSKKSYNKRVKFIDQIKTEYESADLAFFKNGHHFVSAYENYNQELVYSQDNKVDLEETRRFFDQKKEYQQMERLKDEANKSEVQNWALEMYFRHPDFSIYSHELSLNLDYIFYQPSENVKLLSILEIPSIADIEDGIDQGEPPNRNNPSDHQRIEACFKITASQGKEPNPRKQTLQMKANNKNDDDDKAQKDSAGASGGGQFLINSNGYSYYSANGQSRK